MSIKIKRLRQEMGRGPKDGSTPMPRKTKDYQIRRIVGGLKGLKRIFLPRNNQLLFMANMQGKDRKYLTKIRFNELTGKTTDNARSGAVKTETANGNTLYVDPPNLNKNPVDISCTCDDFRFNFEYQLFKGGKHLLDKHSEGAKAGNKARSFTKYDRETEPFRRPRQPENPNPIGRDFKNPDNILGYCKHIHSLMKFLVDRDMVDGTY